MPSFPLGLFHGSSLRTHSSAKIFQLGEIEQPGIGRAFHLKCLGKAGFERLGVGSRMPGQVVEETGVVEQHGHFAGDGRGNKRTPRK